MPDINFPTEVISLPSGGKYYSDENPLSSGEVELKYMTLKEEDILTSANLIRRGNVIEHLLRSLVVNKDINLDTLLLGDKNAIMVASRILGYGKEYKFDYDCPECGEHNKDYVIDLTTLKEREVQPSDDFIYELPVSKRILKFKFLTQSDEKEINRELEQRKKISKGDWVSSEMTTRMKRIITEIDGSSKQLDINKFVDTQFLSQDSLAFRNYLQLVTPDIDMGSEFECKLCGYKEKITVPMTVQFFWPSARR